MATIAASASTYTFSGHHLFAEMYGIDLAKLNDSRFLQQALIDGIDESGATLCGLQTYRFSPQGVSVLALLADTDREEGSTYLPSIAHQAVHQRHAVHA